MANTTLNAKKTCLASFIAIMVALAGAGVASAASTAPSYCAKTGTPLQAPVVGGGSFGFAVSADDRASTIVVGQPDAADGTGLVYSYNQVALCAYQAYELPPPPPPTTKADGAPAGLLGMMAALSRDGRWLAVAGALEGGGTMAQVYVYRRQSNDSTGNFLLHQKLALQPAPTTTGNGGGGHGHGGGDGGSSSSSSSSSSEKQSVENTTTTTTSSSNGDKSNNNNNKQPGRVYSGSLTVSRDGKLVLVSWSVYGAGRSANSQDPYGEPSNAAYGSAQLYRRQSDTGKYARAQADLARLAPPLARTQFFGANSAVSADGSVIAVSTRVIDKTTSSTAGAPAMVVYRRTPSGAYSLLTTLRVPGSDGTFAVTGSGSHLAVVRGSDVHVYVREGDLGSGKAVYNKRCTLVGDEMNLEPTYTKLAMTVSNNATLRLAVGNSLDSVFVWSIPLGGRRAYSDGTCPASLDRTLTGEANSQFGAALAISDDGRALVIGAPGSAQAPEASVLVADIELPRPTSMGIPADQRGLAGIFYNPRAGGGQGGRGGGGAPGGGGLGPSSASSGSLSAASVPSTQAAAPLDNTYFTSNPSTVLVSPRRGSVGVPAPQPFDPNSWAQGSPGGAPYNPQLGYSIAPQNPYVSGGKPVPASAALGLLSAMGGLGLSTAALKAASLGAG